jgi:hypothetical protein
MRMTKMKKKTTTTTTTTKMMYRYDILHQALVREPYVDPHYYYYYYWIGSAGPNSFEERYAVQHATEASLDYRLMKGAVGENGPDPNPRTGPAW